MTQYFFVDESGEPGMANAAGSPYYVMAMAQMPNRERIADLAALRLELHLPPGFEFHFYKLNSAQKELFYQAVQPLAFRVRACVLIKQNIPAHLSGLTGADLTMELLTHLTMRASPLDIANDILVLDGAPESFLKALRLRLSLAYKRLGRERPFKKIVASDSRHDDGLQLADMLAGAIRQYAWANEAGAYQTFARKMVDLWQVDVE